MLILSRVLTERPNLSRAGISEFGDALKHLEKKIVSLNNYIGHLNDGRLIAVVGLQRE
jgi:hypothetical protein